MTEETPKRARYGAFEAVAYTIVFALNRAVLLLQYRGIPEGTQLGPANLFPAITAVATLAMLIFVVVKQLRRSFSGR